MASPPEIVIAQPGPRRKRATVSCSLCRKRKIRCDREFPCSNCAKSRGGTCVYSDPLSSRVNDGQATESGAARATQQLVSPGQSTGDRVTTAETLTSYPSTRLPTASTPASTTVSRPSAEEINMMKSRIQILEAQLSKAGQTPGESSQVNSSSNIGFPETGMFECFQVYQTQESVLVPQPVVRGVMHKTRLFGQSHWISGVTLLLDMIEALESCDLEDKAMLFADMAKAKSLAKTIKSRREPLWPTPPTNALPPKDVADELVDRYLRTYETVFRVLHVPTFKKQYDELWVSNDGTNLGFMVQLKLVLALGAASYDEDYSLRASAVRWIYEAQTWLSQPEFKSRLNMQDLQTGILLLLGREAANIGGSLVWVSIGSLVRIAVHMGLHRDPEYLQIKSTLAREMRRRLWNTILEISLLTSIASGLPPLLSTSDFDTKPPSNFEDDQLTEKDPVPRPEGDFTQISVAIALRKSFGIRLGVTKFLNDIGLQGTYEETIRLDTELRTAHKLLYRTLQGFISRPGPSPAAFVTGFVDMIMHRFITALHTPYFGPALQESKYAFSRKAAVETSLKVWCAAYPPSPVRLRQARGSGVSPDLEDLPRLTVCGSGFLRTTATQASFLIAIELRTQLEQEEGLGPLPIRTDLLSILDDAKKWNLQCIQAGETNMKGFLLMSLVCAHIDGLVQGLGKDDLPQRLIKAAQETSAVVIPMLEENLAKIAADIEYQPLSTQVEFTEDWDFMMEDDPFILGNYQRWF